MKIRAKFQCDSVKNTINGATVELSAVMSGSPENDSFYQWTPAGGIQLSLVQSETAKAFIPGKEYYVDFILAEVESV